MKMSISEKIKAINNKTDQNQAQYNLDRKTPKISTLSSGNVSKYEFLNGKDVLSEKNLLEKSSTIKRFEYSLLGKELNVQTDIEQYQLLNKFFESDEKEESVTIKKERPAMTSVKKTNVCRQIWFQ